ncbi:hypothetical protein BTA51_26275 [Hahella sp. CCB-MM4]|uniref:SAVED domain-containing protein n=1 Tax=Hahella sp. (strain CCB-MM4) TaxID=1926491 RepID=UPI000B9BC862|nr:SAVED domain-containing protein [Hahella sp. CCB-MM4]OZG70352.1 hypothetical protein BTA51_26275 [Hahella sp. CCB-MM4]
METDTTGTCFLSYKRECHEQAAKLVEALRDHGIPVWQDINDLAAGVTETEIRQVLEAPNTASAIMLVSPEVKNSDMIREVEAPGIFKRFNDKNGFFVVLVAAEGVDYSDMADILGPRTGITAVSGVNSLKTVGAVEQSFATEVAQTVLKNRLREILKALPSSVPIKIQVCTRALVNEPGIALCVDLRHRFDNRLAKENAWEDFIKPAIANLVEQLQQSPRRPVELSGKLSIPAATALGVAFLSIAGLKAGWLNDNASTGKAPEHWGLYIPKTASGFITDIEPQSTSADDYALLISVNGDVMDDFRHSSKSLSLRAIVHVKPEYRDDTGVELTAGAATDIALMAVDALRRAKQQYGKRGTVHLFMAVPVALAFMVGQQLNTFGEVQTYEYLAEAKEHPYVPAAKLQPSG